MIKATPPEDAAGQAPAYNTLGDCLRAANRPKDALLAYLHTDMLYSKDKEEHPRALHQISVLFRQLKQDGRADDFAQRLKTEYPHSRGRRRRLTRADGPDPLPRERLAEGRVRGLDSRTFRQSIHERSAPLISPSAHRSSRALSSPTSVPMDSGSSEVRSTAGWPTGHRRRAEPSDRKSTQAARRS